MFIAHNRLVFPTDIALLTRELVAGTCLNLVPGHWRFILVFQPATGLYYASKCKKPFEYEAAIREGKGVKYEAFGNALKKMLASHGDWQFFVLHPSARETVEQYLATQGYRRIATKVGTVAKVEHILYSIYDPDNKITRFVCAPDHTQVSKLINSANAGIGTWLRSTSSRDTLARQTMRTALRSHTNVNPKVFGKNSVVTKRNDFKYVPHNEFRTQVAHLNMLEIKKFIMGTITGTN